MYSICDDKRSSELPEKYRDTPLLGNVSERILERGLGYSLQNNTRDVDFESGMSVWCYISELKYRIKCRNRFGGGCGPVVGQITNDDELFTL